MLSIRNVIKFEASSRLSGPAGCPKEPVNEVTHHPSTGLIRDQLLFLFFFFPMFPGELHTSLSFPPAISISISIRFLTLLTNTSTVRNLEGQVR